MKEKIKSKKKFDNDIDEVIIKNGKKKEKVKQQTVKENMFIMKILESMSQMISTQELRMLTV